MVKRMGLQIVSKINFNISFDGSFTKEHKNAIENHLRECSLNKNVVVTRNQNRPNLVDLKSTTQQLIDQFYISELIK